MSRFATLRVFSRGPTIPAPMAASFRHKPTFFGNLAMERWIALGRSVPPQLKSLASLRAGSLVGCLW